MAAGYDADPPQITGVTIPAVVELGVPVRVSVSVFDVWGASVFWVFGDGGTRRERRSSARSGARAPDSCRSPPPTAPAPPPPQPAR